MDSFAGIRNLIKGGGPKADLSALVKEWFSWCKSNNIRCTYEWIPREENEKADRLSKILTNDWKVNRDVVEKELKDCKPYDWIDKMNATSANGKLIICPEFNQINNTVNFIIQHRLHAIVIHPIWQASAWYLVVEKWRRSKFRLPSVRELFATLPPGADKANWRMEASVFKMEQ
jgi:hypothetical protein